MSAEEPDGGNLLVRIWWGPREGNDPGLPDILEPFWLSESCRRVDTAVKSYYGLTVVNTKLSTKGQLIIPLEVRERHRWRPGTELLVEDHGTHVVLRASPKLPPTNLRDLLGCSGYTGARKSVAEMDLAIAQAIRSRT